MIYVPRYPCHSMGKWGVVISLPTLLLTPLAYAFDQNRIAPAIRFFEFLIEIWQQNVIIIATQLWTFSIALRMR